MSDEKKQAAKPQDPLEQSRQAWLDGRKARRQKQFENEKQAAEQAAEEMKVPKKERM